MEQITVTGPGDLYALETGKIPDNREPVFTFADRAATVQVLRILGQDLRAEVDALTRLATDMASAQEALLRKPSKRTFLAGVIDDYVAELRTRQAYLIDVQRWLDAAIVAADAGSMSRNALANHTGFTLAIIDEFLDGDEDDGELDADNLTDEEVVAALDDAPWTAAQGE